MLADAPHPNAAYAWLDFIHEPEIQAEETNFNLYATPNDAAKEFVDPDILANPAIFPPTTSSPASKAPRTRPATPSGSTSGRSSSPAIGG